MKVTVMGTGGLGGYFGGLLATAGHQVTFVARGAHLDAIGRQGGLRLRTTHGDLFAAATAAERPPADPADLILFTVKSYDTVAAAEAVAPAVGSATAILCMQNGVDNEERLAERFGAARVLGGLAYILSTIGEPGLITQTGGPRRVVFGEWNGGRSDRVLELKERFMGAKWFVETSEDIVREKWVKFAFICGLAGMTALTRLPIGEIRTSPPTWDMLKHIMEEVVAVGRARGVPLGQEVVDGHLAMAQSLEPHGRSSLYHDLAHGHRLEIEALHGTVVRFGREAGVPVPASQAVYAALLPHDLRARAAATG